jgi:hypothetical protein
MRKLMITAGAIAALCAATSAPNIAAARTHHRVYEHHRHGGGCMHEKRRTGGIGAVSGTIGGALIGNAATHGNAGGTLLGAGAGALAGNAIGRHSVRCG